MNTVNSAALGATAQEWQHFDLILGLGRDMLPVVPDEAAKPSPNSKVKKFGKIPSVYTSRNATTARGVANWTEIEITPSMIEGWRSDPRQGCCVRASAVRALDVDVTDAALAAEIDEHITDALASYDIWLPHRTRSNSPKFLMPFYLHGAYAKRIINTRAGRIEFLADGQQWVAAGAHPSGARYEWQGGLPATIPALTPEIFEELWADLARTYSAEPASLPPASLSNESVGGASSADLLYDIDADALADLKDALAFAPLRKAAGSNDVWSEIGYALLTLNGKGYGLFIEFSTQADNFTAGAPESWWGEHIDQKTRTDYRHIFTLARKLGWRATAELSDFPIDNAEPREADRSNYAASDQASAFRLNDSAATVLRDAGKIPEAYSLCTDQANARRISAHFGHRLRSIAGRFYWYTGTHWQRDEGEANRCAANLPKIVKAEADAAATKFKSLMEAATEPLRLKALTVQNAPRRDQIKSTGELKESANGAEIFETMIKMEQLFKWQKHCEMEPTQAKALTMVRNLLTLDAAQLDSHHHLLNCQNGTVNLMTGEIQPHDPANYISCIAPVSYDPKLLCPEFEKFLVEILDHDRAEFLRRWFGYGCTGEISEQKFVLHVGQGGNGKSTLFKILNAVLGKTYISPGAPNLFTGSSERHSTEVADLLGKRIVISQESEEGAYLREAFLKNLSGSEDVKARFLYADFFSFTPTFKLNLSTNHEPNIRGTERGIWRRILVVRYDHKYGSAEDIAAGKATRLEDIHLTQKLLAESGGILNWLVRGAMEWYSGQLKPPTSVIVETAKYQTNQDRMQKFVEECCTIDAKAWSPFTSGMGALYPAYVEWCKAGGYMATGLNKFGAEITRVAPGTSVQPIRRGNKLQNGVQGIRLDADDSMGTAFPNDEANRDLL